MQPVSGLFFDFRLLLFQLLDDAALLYGAPDGQRVVYGGFLTAVDTETGKGTCRDVLCGIGYDLPVECRGGGFPFPDDGQEFDFILNEKRKCYTSIYPFKILSSHRFERVYF